MIAHAWRGYAAYAMGENELKPISRRGHSAVVFGRTKLGATVVDSLDTLYIAGLMEEYKQARDWVENSLNFDQVRWVESEGVVLWFHYYSELTLYLCLSALPFLSD